VNVLVIGLAVSGRAAISLLQSQGHDVVGYDSRPVDQGIDGFRIHTGAWDPAILHSIDLVVPSPGVPETSPIIASIVESGIPIWSELELGFRAAAAPVVGITGTNGKTTVTEVATEMLIASGIDARAVGNIGEPISTAGRSDVLVVEASSFQLRFIDSFAPDAAAIVNFAPDHLDWHPDVASYRAAKARIFENIGEETPLVFDSDDAGAVGLVSGADARLVGVSAVRAGGASGREGDDLNLAGVKIPLSELPRSEPTLLVDLAVAAELAVAVGGTPDGIESAARTYLPGRHRREVVAEVNGVTFIDDSKATNPHAALAAIAAYPSVVLIAGGLAKGLDVQPLARARTVREMVVIGESAEVLAEARPGSMIAADMDEAVDRAISVARPGDVVLLAPGCASFDMFDSYGHRGDVFAATVREKVGA
jgi:UDP-N-acetylmuramoylalanine--D-glutamate ligase